MSTRKSTVSMNSVKPTSWIVPDRKGCLHRKPIAAVPSDWHSFGKQRDSWGLSDKNRLFCRMLETESYLRNKAIFITTIPLRKWPFLLGNFSEMLNAVKRLVTDGEAFAWETKISTADKVNHSNTFGWIDVSLVYRLAFPGGLAWRGLAWPTLAWYASTSPIVESFRSASAWKTNNADPSMRVNCLKGDSPLRER